jgi:hypothetical protein
MQLLNRIYVSISASRTWTAEEDDVGWMQSACFFKQSEIRHKEVYT